MLGGVGGPNKKEGGEGVPTKNPKLNKRGGAGGGGRYYLKLESRYCSSHSDFQISDS